MEFISKTVETEDFQGVLKYNFGDFCYDELAQLYLDEWAKNKDLLRKNIFTNGSIIKLPVISTNNLNTLDGPYKFLLELRTKNYHIGQASYNTLANFLLFFYNK